MPNATILVIEDEEEILELIRYSLGKQGYQVLCASSGEEGLAIARRDAPNLILLDLMLPGLDGLEVFRRLKRDARTQGIPVIMVTAKDAEVDVVTGFEMGVDDYVTKPFSPRVLVARVRAVLRRNATPAGDDATVIRMHGLTIHPGRHEVLVDGQPVELTATEFRILRILAERPGWVFSRTQIAALVHGGDLVVTDRSVDVQVVGLRKKLGARAACLETVRGVGYRCKQ